MTIACETVTPVQLLDSILHENPDPRLDTLLPFIPLSAPGMPMPGPDFLRAAQFLGNAPILTEGKGTAVKLVGDGGKYLHYLYRRALYDADFGIQVEVKGSLVSTKLVPGHIWGDSTTDFGGGPRRANVMVIGKNPGAEEAARGRNFVGPTSEEFTKAITALGLDLHQLQDWYLTNLVKWPQLDVNSGSLPGSQIRDCAVLLQEEIKLVRPRYILCLGSDASKALLGTPFSVEAMTGRVEDYRYSTLENGQLIECMAKVMTAIHPAAVFRTPERAEDMESQISLFWQLVQGAQIGEAEKGVDHADIYSLKALRHVVDQMLADPRWDAGWIAVDAEWHGEAPGEPGAYLRTIQLSNKDKWARTIVLRHQGGVEAFRGGIEAAIHELRRLFFTLRPPDRPLRVGGHFFRADLPWLLYEGLDLRELYAPHPDPTQVHLGGWDTSLGYHAYNETASFKLEDMATRLTTVPRYDKALQKWKRDYCARHKIKAGALEGYGDCPVHILHPYASFDSDATRRCAMRLFGPGGLVFSDNNGCNSWMAYWTGHRASLAFLEMEMTGFQVDRQRADQIATRFMAAVERLTAEIRQEINWPGFNPRSHQHVLALLFGDSYGLRKDPVTKLAVPVRPPGALTLNLTPIKTTGKRAVLWEKVVRQKQQHMHKPCTDKEVLGTLGQQHPVARKLRDLKFLMQVLSSSLRAPTTDIETGEFDTDEDGNYEYDAGLLGSILSDGRVHTHLFQTKETGRAASARPPLQNFAKRREDDYRRILTEEVHVNPIRSVLCVPPGYIGIECDLKAAEVAVTAWQAQDKNMIEHVARANLDENDPNFYDIHAQMAVRAFHLNCAPTKKGLYDAGCPGLRVAAKCVVAGTLLQTTVGWIPVEQFAEGLGAGESRAIDNELLVSNDSDEMTPVIAAYNGGTKACVRVQTDLGYELTGTREHLYRVVDDDGIYGWRTAGDLRLGDWVCVRNEVGPFGADTVFPARLETASDYRSAKNMSFPEHFTEDWAAFLGLWVAEGGLGEDLSCVSVSVSIDASYEFYLRVRELLQRLFSDRVGEIELVDKVVGNRLAVFQINCVHLGRWMYKFFGRLSQNIRLPQFVFNWPSRLLSKFFSWMFEGDGSAKTSGKSFNICYSTSSRQLAVDSQRLLLSFGVLTNRSSETREGYDGVYWSLSAFSNLSRDRFVEHIGFVTHVKKSRCVSTSPYKLDMNVIPNQVARLRKLLKYTPGLVKEKCQECTRENARVNLNPSRLRLILDATANVVLPDDSRLARDELLDLLNRPLSFQKVILLEDMGDKPVFDVQTTKDNVVVYDGLVVHQSVIFGTPYGRGPEAISRQLAEEGTLTSVDDCRRLQDGYFEGYPRVWDLFEEAKHRSQDPRWLCNPYGRFRRFRASSDRSVIGDQERQAMNFPIQSSVADAISIALYNLLELRKKFTPEQLDYKIMLQIHDAIVLLVPIRFAGLVYHDVLPYCMEQLVDFWPAHLDGSRMQNIVQPYHFGSNRECFVNWGEPITPDRAALLGLPSELAS